MLFRTSFTTDVDSHYSDIPSDVCLSLTIEANSFDEAVLKAKHLLSIHLFWPELFETLSVERIDS
jgi:hypothetical protein